MQNCAKKHKKGFTLTELAIVIAVIAILIAVLVPTFVSLINKANESVDEQAVKNMNTALSTHEATEDINTVADVVNALAEDNYDLDNYSPLISGMQFYWVKSIKRVVYADASTYEVAYPAEYTSLEYDIKDGWYSLNGGIELDNSYTTTTDKDGKTTYKIENGAQLASLMDSFSTSSTGTYTIELQSNVDLMGASYNLKTIGNSKQTTKTTATVTINIKSEGTNTYTIYGFRNDSNTSFGTGEYAEKGYGYGIFGEIFGNAEVNITNVNFDGMVVEDTLEDTGTMGLVVGYCYGALNMTNVTFTNCSITGKQKVAAIAGRLQNGSIKLTSVEFENTTVYASCEGAKLIGYVYGVDKAGSTFSYDDDCKFSGITVVANDDYYSYYKDENPLGSFTTTQDGFECLFVYHNKNISTGTLDRGDLVTVTTQALYIYSVTEVTLGKRDSENNTKYYGSDVKYGKTVTYNGETYYLRSTNNPGSAAFGS